MPNYLHRTTKQYQTSVSTITLPEPVGNYIQDPDLSAVAEEPIRYWTITGDVVSLKNQSEQDAVDAAILSAQRDDLANEIDSLETFMKGFAEVMLDQLNTLRDLHGLPAGSIAQLKTAVRNKLDN